MSASVDAFGQSGSTFSSPGHTFTISGGTPSGVVIFVHQAQDQTPETIAVAVDNGGTPVNVPYISGFPVGASTFDAVGGAAYHAYFLGSGVPSGTLTVEVTSKSGSNVCFGSGYTIDTASGAPEVNNTDVGIDSNSVADPSAVLTLGGVESLVLMPFTSGQADVGDVSPRTGWTSDGTFDPGAITWHTHRYDTVGTSDVTYGWTQTTDNAFGMAVAINEAAGGDHDLIADDIESDSEVTSPSIGQVHSITADDVESSSEVGSPAISQVHSLTADDVESTSEVSSPALAESHDLTADDVESSSEVTSPSISQVHAITADDVESQSEVSSPAVGQVHGLTADDVESSSEVSSPTLQSGNHALTADDVESQSELTSPALTQVHALLADDVESASEVDVPVLNREVSSGGHFMPGLAGIRAGKRREPREAFQEAAEITERVIDEVLPPVEEKPVQRVSRKQKAAIIEQAAEAFREQQVFIGELHALDRAADLISKIALKRRREALRRSQETAEKRQREAARPIERIEPQEDEEELFVLLLMVANL